MQLDHPTEMEAVDGKCNCRWEEVRTPEQGLEKSRHYLLDAFDTAQAQLSCLVLLFASHYLDAFSIPAPSGSLQADFPAARSDCCRAR
jgi:hypothetical protein